MICSSTHLKIFVRNPIYIGDFLCSSTFSCFFNVLLTFSSFLSEVDRNSYSEIQSHRIKAHLLKFTILMFLLVICDTFYRSTFFPMKKRHGN